MRVMSVLSLLLVACTGPGTDDSGRPKKDGNDGETAEVTLTLVAPEAGQTYAAEDPLALHVEAKKNGNPVAIESATWTIGGWTGSGKETEASGLPSGPLTVNVEAVVGGEPYTASVDVVIAEPVQTTFNYGGTLEADVVLESDFGDFDDHCSAPITFTVDAGTITGGGQCMVFSDFVDDPLVFTMEGTVRGGTIQGNLVMSGDGEEARTPFTGTGRPGEPLTASFDSTHRSSDGSLRIVGSWSGTVR